jgi:SAM-dependent methyltransferase
MTHASAGSAKYGDACAEYYDELYGAPKRATILRLLEWVGTGEALELGIGTGRTAIRLAREGVSISGIEGSSAMLEKLRSKPEGAAIPVMLADFSDATPSINYSLIFALHSTIHLLPSAQAQTRCFRNMSGSLTSDGVFVVEAEVPGSATGTNPAGPRGTRGGSPHRVRSSFSLPTAHGEREYRVEMWRSTPEELDSMAERANLQLTARWADWVHTPFGAESPSHVSVYSRTNT